MKKIILILITSLSFFLFSCGNTEIKNSEVSKEVNEVQETNNSIGVVDNKNEQKFSKEECLKGYNIMWKSNPGNKGKTEAEMNTDGNTFCDAQQGMQNNDESSCEKSQGILKDTCYSEIAKDKKDSKICEKMSEEMLKNACYTGVAEVLKDPKICEKIDSDIFKTSCIDSATQK